jgi:hypothetical protein
MEKELFSRGERKIIPAVGAFQCFIKEFHCPHPAMDAGHTRISVIYGGRDMKEPGSQWLSRNLVLLGPSRFAENNATLILLSP